MKPELTMNEIEIIKSLIRFIADEDVSYDSKIMIHQLISKLDSIIFYMLSSKDGDNA